MSKSTTQNNRPSYRSHLHESKELLLPLVALWFLAIVMIISSLIATNLLLKIVWTDTPIFVL